MRNISLLVASFMLLTTQANNPLVGIAASAQAPAQTERTYEVSLNTNTSTPIVISGQKQPNYDTEVLQPLHAAQAEAAAKAAQAAAAAEAAAAQAAAAAKAAQAKAAVQAAAVATPPQGDLKQLAYSILSSRGMADQWGAMDFIITHESGWNLYSRSAAGACGLPQANPCSKIVWGDANQQINWFIGYCVGRYGSISGAYAHWLTYRSY
ncbi:MAG TPA: hypothetical protein VLI05_03955 [Candidatus Saccharimonadia bacterium]|nr:hypothetical protein [Candidatus Saccharimonadia bacterium]